jgi:hypothetical protein
VHEATSVDKARLEQRKATFANSDKNFQTIGDTVFRKNANGDVTATSKIKYDYQLGTSKLSKAKASDNLKDWMNIANSQLDSLDKQLQDPNIDELDRVQLENDAQKLLDDISKYAGYGGFTKGKSGGKNGGLGISTANMGVSVTPTSRTGRPSVNARGGQLRSVASRGTTSRPRVTVKKSRV